MLHAVRTIGLLVLALVALSARGQSDAERTFRKWADEHVQVLQKDRNAGERIKAAEYLGGFEYPDVISGAGRGAGRPRFAGAGRRRRRALEIGQGFGTRPRASAAGARRSLAGRRDPRGGSAADARHVERRTRRRAPTRVRDAGHPQQRPLHGGARTDRLCAARDAPLPDPRVPGACRRAATLVGAEYRRARELRERRERARAPGEDRRSRVDRADGRDSTRGAQQPSRVAEGARPVRPQAGWLERDAGGLSRIARSQGPRSVVESAQQGASTRRTCWSGRRAPPTC